ncbi:hypothetical protein OS493_034335 [Desmophyllum pertusum]|uniref:DNA2/NAM7 helicase helicase domain-containing protein n=1 Tax=Desmophyllum pertusum TaxID=174260 RepID=A0A9X0CHJ3_9CNID|nr:hypothetical protein OS493_034335 [Desmophyllum pertusum]
MAKVLASSLVKNSSGQSAIDFMEKLSLTIAIEVPGVHTDLEALSWRELPLLPVSEEIQRDTWIETNDLPVIRKEGKYQSEEEYLNTYFTLLREECFHKLRKGISEFTNKGKSDSKDVMIYRIALKGLSTLHREYSPTTMSIELEFKLDSQERIDWGSTSWHLFGNLLCISFDESFERPVWAMVENVKLSEGQSVISVILCGGKTNSTSEAEFITKMQEITDKGEEAYMAESQTFYLSFVSAMEILQHKDFCSIQRIPVGLALKNKVALIQGPPGTGKSFVGVTLVRLFIVRCVYQKHLDPSLVVTYKNNALDHFLEEKIGRVLIEKGRLLVARTSIHTKEKADWATTENARSCGRGYLNLQRSSVFNAEMFLKASSESQIKELLVKRKGNSADPAEGEKLLNERNAGESYKSHLKGYVEKRTRGVASSTR